MGRGFKSVTLSSVCICLQTQLKEASGGRGGEAHRTLHAPGEAPPVGEHHEGQALAVEVTDGLGRLERRVGEPHLACLLQELDRESITTDHQSGGSTRPGQAMTWNTTFKIHITFQKTYKGRVEI